MDSLRDAFIQKRGYEYSQNQQDCDEFITFLLNELHDEFVATHPDVSNRPESDEAHRSPLHKIFWGKTRSFINDKRGNEVPFLTIHLDILHKSINSVNDALEYFLKKKNISECVSQELLLEETPEVLLLTLKRIKYTKYEIKKIAKRIDIPISLEIVNSLISPEENEKRIGPSSTHQKYQLVSIIYHDGEYATDGHYVSTVYHPGYNCWILHDDTRITAISPNDLYHENKFGHPYMLFYRREDTIKDQNKPKHAFGIW